MIAALYVMADGIYSGRPDVECWDEARDARNYAGPWPVGPREREAFGRPERHQCEKIALSEWAPISWRKPGALEKSSILRRMQARVGARAPWVAVDFGLQELFLV